MAIDSSILNEAAKQVGEYILEGMSRDAAIKLTLMTGNFANMSSLQKAAYRKALKKLFMRD